MSLRGLFGGPAWGAEGLGFGSYDRTFQDFSPLVEVDEGFLDFDVRGFEVRLGAQKFTWGKLDVFSPADILSPRRFTDPFLREGREAKLAQPALFLARPLALGTNVRAEDVEFVWVPWSVPPRFPLEDERWFPPSVRPEPLLEIPFGALAPGQPRLAVRTTLEMANRAPPRRPDRGAFGVRLRGSVEDVGWSLSLYHGPETAPAFSLLPSVRLTGADPEGFLLGAQARLRPRYGRVSLVGVDLERAYDLVTLRIEAAWSRGRLWPRPAEDLLSPENLGGRLRPELASVAERLFRGETVPLDLGPLFVRRDALQWGIGGDVGSGGTVLTLQLDQTWILHNATPLLLTDVQTRVLASLRRDFWQERFRLEGTTVATLERPSAAVWFELLSELAPGLELRAGLLFLEGSSRSLVGQYDRNDQAFLRLRTWF